MALATGSGEPILAVGNVGKDAAKGLDLPVEWAANGAGASVQDVLVDHGRGQVAVSEQFLDGASLGFHHEHASRSPKPSCDAERSERGGGGQGRRPSTAPSDTERSRLGSQSNAKHDYPDGTQRVR